MSETQEHDKKLLQEFVDVLKKELGARLKLDSLKLVDIGMEFGPVREGKRTYNIHFLVERPISGELKKMIVNGMGFDELGHTTPSDILELVNTLSETLRKDFYSTASKFAQIIQAGSA